MFRFGSLSLLLTCLALTATDTSMGGSDQRVTGTILSATNTQVILMVGTESRTFVVNAQTKFTLNGKMVQPDELRMEDRAEVTAIKTDGLGLVAETVTASRSNKPGLVAHSE